MAKNYKKNSVLEKKKLEKNDSDITYFFNKIISFFQF